MDRITDWTGLDEWLRGALAEDIGSGDATTGAVVPVGAKAEMEWVAKSPLLACGLSAAARTFALLDPAVQVRRQAEDARACAAGETILNLAGEARALLSAERVALNLVQHLCGVAGLTRAYVEAVAGTRARIAATRKTMPYLRRLEKYAVGVGGGVPHRFGLDDGVLIKDNHIALAGSVAEAVTRARAHCHHLLRIEVEVTSLTEAEEAVRAGADVLLLDNMETEQIRRVVQAFSGRVLLEASGNMTRERAAAAAAAGVDVISVGALTHSAPAADISARVRTGRE